MFATYIGVTVVYTSGVEAYETHDESIEDVKESLSESLEELGVKTLISELAGGETLFSTL